MVTAFWGNSLGKEQDGTTEKGKEGHSQRVPPSRVAPFQSHPYHTGQHLACPASLSCSL